MVLKIADVLGPRLIGCLTSAFPNSKDPQFAAHFDRLSNTANGMTYHESEGRWRSSGAI
jgi:hypothetical protein